MTIDIKSIEQEVINQLTPLLTGASIAELQAIITFTQNTSERFAARQEVLTVDGDADFVIESLKDEVPIMASQLETITVLGQQLAEDARVTFIQNLAMTIMQVIATILMQKL